MTLLYKILTFFTATIISFLLFNFLTQKDEVTLVIKKQRQENVKPSFTQVMPFISVKDTVLKYGFNISDALPTGYVKDGSVDYTSYVQSAILEHNKIIFPAFPILINEAGLTIPSNRTINFQKGSELRLKPTTKHHYNVLKIYDAENIVLLNPIIRGDRFKHLGTTGEWGMGIGIYGSSNITIYGPKVYNCWGDGIYIGKSSNNAVSYNIRIADAYCSNNRRNGISVISCIGLKLQSPYCIYSKLCGIDIEPDHPDEEIRDITIINPVTKYSNLIGLQLALSRMYDGAEKDIGTINIINHKDVESKEYAFKVSAKPKINAGGTIKGIIKTSNAIWENPGTGRPNFIYVIDSSLKIYFLNPKVINETGRVLTAVEISRLIKLNNRSGNCILTF